MLIMLIMLIKKVAQSCRLGNKAEFVHKPIGNMNQSKNLTLLTISRFSGRQLDYIRCVGNSVLGIAFKCRPIDYHPMFPNIRLIYSNQETTN